MEWNTIDKYLVQIGADIDQNSFNSAKSALSELKAHLVKLKGAAAPLALAAAIGAIGKAAYDTITGVAKADMEYKKLAASMWTTKETAKALSVAMKTMGVSQDDIAWVPELRQQFFRLRAEIQKFATPADADAQLRYIREIGYDVQALFVRLKMLKEWIAYYLIQYLEPYIEDFRAFLNWLLDKIGTDMPGFARKIASAMTAVLSPALATLKAFGALIANVYDFIKSLPENVKKWAAVFAAVGAVIMAGPFGAFLMALSAAMLLIEDFYGYMNGWKSSQTMAPIWKALIDFSKGTGAEWLEGFKKSLTEIAGILDDIFKGLDIGKRLEDLKPHAKFLLDSMKDFVSAFGKLISDHEKGKGKVKGFWFDLGDAIGKSISQLGKLGSLLGFVVKMVSAVMRKDWKGAESLAKSAAIYGLGAIAEGLSGQLEFMGVSVLGNDKRYDDNVNDRAREAWKQAQRIAPDLNIDPAILYGQWYHETKGFTSDLAVNDNNIGGLTQTEARAGYHQPDGSLYYMSFGSYKEFADYYKRVWGPYIKGSKSAEEFTRRLKNEGYYGDTYERYTAGTLNGMQHIPMSHDGEKDTDSGAAAEPSIDDTATTAKIAKDMLSGIGLKNSYAGSLVGGSGLTPAWGGGYGGSPGLFNFGGATVNINVNSTNATPREIGEAARSGVEQGMDGQMHIFQRLMRRPEK